MPCKYCLGIFSEKPCLTPYYKDTDFEKAHPNRKIYYENIGNKCPCIDCLIKTICFEGRTNCDVYQNFLGSLPFASYYNSLIDLQHAIH